MMGLISFHSVVFSRLDLGPECLCEHDDLLMPHTVVVECVLCAWYPHATGKKLLTRRPAMGLSGRGRP